jgi:hypothetical protein
MNHRQCIFVVAWEVFRISLHEKAIAQESENDKTDSTISPVPISSKT